jgi:SAM-dependent methyltransferase
VTPEHFDDPVAAYDRLAPHYRDLSLERELYLKGVEREIISRIPRASRSLLDVGAGDGTRALRIASRRGIERVVLVEPSREMAGKAAERAEVWPVRAEDIDRGCMEKVGQELWSCDPGTDENVHDHAISQQFDVITCLWNVLGHVPTPETRLRALRAIARLVAPHGRFLLDVNHRYNLSCYGTLPTSVRWIRDLLLPGQNNGDVVAKWQAGNTVVTTYGHVFTHREVKRLAYAAGLEMEERVVLDYDNGRTRRFAFQGNLLYVFRRSSRIDSSTAPQTS